MSGRERVARRIRICARLNEKEPVGQKKKKFLFSHCAPVLGHLETRLLRQWVLMPGSDAGKTVSLPFPSRLITATVFAFFVIRYIFVKYHEKQDVDASSRFPRARLRNRRSGTHSRAVKIEYDRRESDVHDT